MSLREKSPSEVRGVHDAQSVDQSYIWTFSYHIGANQ